MSNKEDKLVVAICNPVDARMLLRSHPDMRSALIETELVPVGEALVIDKDEFLKWIYGNEVDKNANVIS